MVDIRVCAFAQGLDISPGRFVGRHATDDALKVDIGVLEGRVQAIEFVEVITHSGSQVLFAVYALVGDDGTKREFCEFCTLVECFANFIESLRGIRYLNFPVLYEIEVGFDVFGQ